MSLSEFRKAHPDVAVDLPDGRYTITATEHSTPTLAIAARVENQEPLARMVRVQKDRTIYQEMLSGGFIPSRLRPETAVLIIDSRLTFRSKTADRQRLEFRAHDGFQRTGPEAARHSGLVELIIMQAEAVRWSDLTFKPFVAPKRPDYGSFGLPNYFGTRDSFGPDVLKSGGLAAGETRYCEPVTIPVETAGVRNLNPIAAFRFALTGSHENR